MFWNKKKPVPAVKPAPKPRPPIKVESDLSVVVHTSPIKLTLVKESSNAYWDGTRAVTATNKQTYEFLLSVDDAVKVRDALDKVLTDLGR